MLFFMKDQRFEKTIKKADEVLKELALGEEQVVDTADLVKVIGRMTNTEINVIEMDFDSVDPNCKYGAMMSVVKKGKKQKAIILLNNNKRIDAKFKKFSLVHELGHLATGEYNLAVNNDEFTLSSHIDYTLVSIKEEDYNENAFLLNEEKANVFALLVLLPFEKLKQKLSYMNIREAAAHFGVSEDAIHTRLDLGE